MNRRTLAAEIAVEGTALHSGERVRMILSPAPAGRGVTFRRSDLGVDIPARYDCVSDTKLGTAIARGGASVGVIEHLMAAISGAEIDDLVVAIEGPEPPILDGDAQSYLSLIDRAGVRELAAPRRAIRVERPVEIARDGASASLTPSPRRSFAFEIDFASRAIGRQTYAFDFSERAFRREIAPARTFGFLHELDALRKMDRGRGASLDNTLAIDGDRVVNAGLMRFADEFVRHKILDAVGDMALAGAPLLARFEGRRSGHALNNALLRKLFADPSNYAEVNLT